MDVQAAVTGAALEELPEFPVRRVTDQPVSPERHPAFRIQPLDASHPQFLGRQPPDMERAPAEEARNLLHLTAAAVGRCCGNCRENEK
jgi:hypothetical protein